MIKIDFDFEIGSEMGVDGSKANEVLSRYLLVRPSGLNNGSDADKAYEWGLHLKDNNTLQIDKVDAKKILESLANNPELANFARVPLRAAIEKAISGEKDSV